MFECEKFVIHMRTRLPALVCGTRAQVLEWQPV